VSDNSNLLLINSNDKDAFAALSLDGRLIVSKASDFIDAANPLDKKPDKLIHCVHKISKETDLESIAAIAVTIGPGSFTGIRVGLSIAKGLALGLDKKIIPINNFTLTLNRINNILSDKQYCVLIPAKLPEYYYSIITNGIQQSTGCVEIENLSNITDKGTMIVSDFDDETSIKHSYFEYINVKDLNNELDSMHKLAVSSLNNAAAPENIEPLYMKDFVIKTHKD
jgi:tRNA threonylcarbamoyl adenosine modification protein YeaZ